MTIATAGEHGADTAGEHSLLPGIVFSLTFALAWITLSPYGDLGSNAMLELSSGNETLTYILYAVLATTSGAWVLARHRPAIRAVLTLPNLALIGWSVVTVVISQEPGMSLRRFVLFALVLVIASSLFLMARSRAHLSQMIALPLALMVLMSYVGVALFPQYAVHQLTDVLEPQLAGDWRGVFSHKNMAGAAFAIATMMSLYVARRGHPVLGWGLTLACGLFVVMSGSKSSTMLLFGVLALAPLVMRIHKAWLRATLIIAPLLFLSALGLGSVASPTLAQISKALPLESTFTGRTDIWTFGMEKAGERLFTGYGFGAFWDTETTKYGGEDSTIWAGGAAHAHNSYLDTVLTMGLPGLMLALLAFVAVPLLDIGKARDNDADPALVAMLTQIWLFTLYVSCFETIFFARAGGPWITFLFAVFGLRYLASFRMQDGA